VPAGLGIVGTDIGCVAADDHPRVEPEAEGVDNGLDEDGAGVPRHEGVAEPLMSTSLPRLGDAEFGVATALDSSGEGTRVSSRRRSRTLRGIRQTS
jgi:hypothetical protein